MFLYFCKQRHWLLCIIFSNILICHSQKMGCLLLGQVYWWPKKVETTCTSRAMSRCLAVCYTQSRMCEHRLSLWHSLLYGNVLNHSCITLLETLSENWNSEEVTDILPAVISALGSLPRCLVSAASTWGILGNNLTRCIVKCVSQLSITMGYLERRGLCGSQQGDLRLWCRYTSQSILIFCMH